MPNDSYVPFSPDIEGLDSSILARINTNRQQELYNNAMASVRAPDLSTPEGIRASLNDQLSTLDFNTSSYLTDPTQILTPDQLPQQNLLNPRKKKKFLNQYAKAGGTQYQEYLKGQQDNDIQLDSVDEQFVSKKSIGEKFQNGFLGQNASSINQGLGALGEITNSLGGKDPYSTPNGALRKGIDASYNAVADVAANFGPYGQLISMGMKAANMLNGIQGAIFGATDGMTKTDAIMDSPLGFLTGLGWVNQAFGKKSDTITKDDEAFAQVGSSYGGSNALVDDSLNYSGKKYGLFSSGARKDANSFIAEARRQNQTVGNIADNATDRFALQGSMAAINGNRRAFALQGGYNQAGVRVGRNGLSLKTILALNKPKKSVKEKTNTIEELSLEQFQKGGVIESNTINELSIDKVPIEFIENSFINESTLDSILPEFGEGGALALDDVEGDTISEISLDDLKYSNDILEKPTEYVPENIDKLIKFVNSHKKINFVQRLKDSYRETIPDWEYDGSVATHKMSVVKNRGKIKVFPMVQEINGELHDFTDPKYEHDKYDALESAEKNGDVIVFDNFDDAFWFTENYKQYYPTFNKYSEKKTLTYDEDKDEYIFNFAPDSQRTLDELNWYNSDDPEAVQFRQVYEYDKGLNKYLRKQVDSFKEGGTFNVIPEGALHARLHHMENAENLTKKGIPVVAEKEDGELEQQAEIEREEVIFRLEVTQKLEELKKKYENNQYSQKEKDQFAVEAGKLLTYELLQNTVDNTGLLNKTQ